MTDGAYRSQIAIVVGLCRRSGSLDQVLPSFALNPRRRWGLSRHRLAAFYAQSSGEVLGFVTLMFRLSCILANGRLARPLELAAALDWW